MFIRKVVQVGSGATEATLDAPYGKVRGPNYPRSSEDRTTARGTEAARGGYPQPSSPVQLSPEELALTHQRTYKGQRAAHVQRLMSTAIGQRSQWSERELKALRS